MDNQPELLHEHAGSSRELLTLAFPMILAFMSQSLMGMVDTLIIGMVGTPEQGGVGLAAAMFWGILALFGGTLFTISTFVSQSHGAGQLRDINRWLFSALAMILPMTLLVWTTRPLMGQVLSLVAKDPAVEAPARDYLFMIYWQLPFLYIRFVMISTLMGLGDSRTPMFVTLGANLLNGVLDLILVFGWLGIPAMGAQGAALASVLAMATSSLVYGLIYFRKDMHRRFLTRTRARPELGLMLRLLKTGLPVGVAWMFESIAWGTMTGYVTTLGPTELAAHVIVFQLCHMSFMPALGLSHAGATLVGRFLGARRRDLAGRASKIALGWSALYAGLISVVFVLFGESLIGFFNEDLPVINIGWRILLVAAAFQVFDIVSCNLDGILRGAGDTMVPTVMRSAMGLLVFVPGIFLLGESLDLGIYGAWLAGLIFLGTYCLLILKRYLGGRWKSMLVID